MKKFFEALKIKIKQLIKKDNSGSFYAIYFPKKKEYIIVTSHIEADKYRKGNYNLTEKFLTKKEALKWIEECKAKDFNETTKKSFYAIYFTDTVEECNCL